MAKKKAEQRPRIKPDIPDRVFMAEAALICLAVFMAPLIAGRLLPIPALIIESLIFLAGALWAYRSYHRGKMELPSKTVAISIAGFLIMLLLSAGFSVNKGLSVRGFMTFLSYILLFVMAADFKEKPWMVAAILASLCASTLIVGVNGLNEYIRMRSAGWRTFSTFFNPDFLAGFMCMMLPVLLAWCISALDVKAAILFGFTTLVVLGNLLLTGSRLGFVATVVGILVFLLLAAAARLVEKRQIVRLIGVAVPAVLVFFILSTPLTARMGSVQAVKAESHSGSFRILTWTGTMNMAKANPILGTGIGTFEEAYPKYAVVGFTKLAHNSYLQIAGESGVPALLFLLTALISMGVISVRQTIRGHDSQFVRNTWLPSRKLLMCGLIGGICASVARNAVDSDWYVMSLGVSFWSLVGILFALLEGRYALSLKKPAWKYAPVIPSVFLVIAVMMLIGELWSESAASQAAVGNRDAAIKSYRMAIMYDPINAEYHRKLGQIYALPPPDIEMCIMELQKSIKLAPSSAKGYFQLAKVYAALGRNSDSIRYYQLALKCDPNSPQILLALAREYESAGERERALDIYNQMIRVEESPYEKVRAVPEIVQPEYIFAHQAIAVDYEMSGNKEEALRHYRLALQRIEAYEKSMQGMAEIMQAGGARDVGMEREVEAAKWEILRRIDSLTRGSRLS